MKKSKLTKTLAGMLVATSILTVAPIGASANEWKQSNGNWWYDKDNSYSVGWEQINGAWYFFGQDGYMKTGWIQDAGNWYYLNSNGSMATNTWIGSYWVGADGIWNKSSTPSTNVKRRPSGANGSIEGSKGQGGAQDKELGDALNNGHK